MHRFRLGLFLLILSLPYNAVRADVLVLVHGWAADADTWVQTGVLPVLESRGWRNAGVVSSSPAGVQYFPAGYPAQAANRVYRVQLPAAAPLLVQASHLTSQLAFIQAQHPSEAMTVAGHSAGGVVARLVVIRPDYVRIKSLITIASPNLGTPRAFDGLDIVESKPFFCPGPGIDFLKTMLGGSSYQYLKDSRGTMSDLVPATPGSLLGWLNQQPHPDIEYHAVIHGGDDVLVPALSQDLNQVPAVRGRAHRYVTPSAHGLNPADGALLAGILAQG